MIPLYYRKNLDLQVTPLPIGELWLLGYQCQQLELGAYFKYPFIVPLIDAKTGYLDLYIKMDREINPERLTDWIDTRKKLKFLETL